MLLVLSLTLFRMGLLGLLMGGGNKKSPPPQNLSHISYNDKTRHIYVSPKKDPKNISIT